MSDYNSFTNITRPRFKSGCNINNQIEAPPLLPSERKGLGNYDITRKNFITPRITGRRNVDFEQLQQQDISDNGVKINLGDKALESLFKVQLNDPDDTSWILEFNRRKALGETVEQINSTPPFGRPQRKISKNINFAQQGLTLENKIDSIQTATDAGRMENKADIARITAQVMALLTNVDDLKKMTVPQLTMLSQSISRLKISSNWRDSFPQRVYNSQEFLVDKGAIVMYLMSNIPANRTINEPLVSYSRLGYRPCGLLQVFNMATKNKSIDLQDRSIETDISLAAKRLQVVPIQLVPVNALALPAPPNPNFVMPDLFP
jgi:hypothetical protein